MFYQYGTGLQGCQWEAVVCAFPYIKKIPRLLQQAGDGEYVRAI